VGQSLSLLKNRILLLKRDLRDNNSLDEISNVVTGTIQEIRSITYGLRPLHLDMLGLTQSLKSLAEDTSEATQIKFNTQIDNIDGLFTKEDEINIYRIIQECVNNITKHSKASEVNLLINKHNGKILIQIEDNGIGIENGRNGKGMGMVGISERVNLLKGNIEIKSSQTEGTRIKIFI
jgi:signal transduction histidine kinase